MEWKCREASCTQTILPCVTTGSGARSHRRPLPRPHVAPRTSGQARDVQKGKTALMLWCSDALTAEHRSNRAIKATPVYIATPLSLSRRRTLVFRRQHLMTSVTHSSSLQNRLSILTPSVCPPNQDNRLGPLLRVTVHSTLTPQSEIWGGLS